MPFGRSAGFETSLHSAGLDSIPTCPATALAANPPYERARKRIDVKGSTVYSAISRSWRQHPDRPGPFTPKSEDTQ